MSERVLNFHDFVMLALALECVLLAVLFNVLSSSDRFSKWALSGFLLVLGGYSVATVLLWNLALSLPAGVAALLPLILVMTGCARGPLLYLFAMKALKYELSHRWRWLHIAPVLMVAAVALGLGFSPADLRYEGLQGGAREVGVKIFWHSIKVLPGLYAFVIIWRVNQYSKQIKDNLADPMYQELTLLWTLAMGFAAIWAWEAFVHLVGGAGVVPAAVSNTLALFDNYIAFALVTGLFIYSMRFADTMPQMHVDSTAAQPKGGGEPPDSKMDVDPNDIARVEAAILQRKIHLEPGVTIKQLADCAQMSVHSVSQVISRHFGKSFFEFINHYRIEEAKRLLSQPECRDDTILDILLRSGFNSTSTFHRQFTRIVGEPPSEYRKQHLGQP